MAEFPVTGIPQGPDIWASLVKSKHLTFLKCKIRILIKNQRNITKHVA